MRTNRLERGLEHHQAGRRQEAERIYREVLARDPSNADALHLLGLLAKEAGDRQGACNLIRKAVELEPRAALLHNNLGSVLESLERLDEAIQCYERALQLDPGYAEAELNMGNALLRKGQLPEALEHYERALGRSPNLAEAHNNLGVTLRALGRTRQAAECYREAIRLKPDYADAHVNLGALLFAQGETAEAERSFRTALRLRPELADMRGALTAVLIAQERFGEAEELCRENLRYKPGDPDTLNYLGISLQMQERYPEAVDSYRQALAGRPDFAQAYQNLGTCFILGHRLEEAAECCRAALRIHPRYAEAHNTLGHALAQMGRLEDAIFCYRQALALKPAYAEALNNLAAALLELGHLGRAISACREALAADPRFFRAFNNLGTALYQQGDVECAVAAFRQALALRPGYASAHSNLLFCLNYDECWQPEAVLAEHRAWGAAQVPLSAAPPRPRRALRRVGYLSPDFREHPVGVFVEPVVRAHDRAAFEIHLFSNVGRPDAATLRFQAMADGWHDIRGLADEEAAQLIRGQEIDILVDLAGHTSENRLPLFARRPAPIQVTYCGYPNTTGLEAIQYRLTDQWADPPGLTEHLYTEKLVRLPRGFLCYAPPAGAPEVGDLPARKTGRVTFGSFNALPKVRPACVAVWSEILRRVPESRLILKSKGLADPEARQRIHALFAGQGIAEPRVELALTLPSHAHHLELYNSIDIALDTFPYHGTTTTCEALWMGVPVAVLAGATHVSRVGVSLLERLGLAYLVADSPEAYIDRAVALAGDLDCLASLRRGLRRRMRGSPLTDAIRFTRDLEDAYRRIWEERREAGETACPTEGEEKWD
ncbi:MAG: tetratricopeptide repeat protein [Bryobacteraceae bacterium]|jgi:predicted O-linked N-acetylglucosamine transferase (SPINDLY family)